MKKINWFVAGVVLIVLGGCSSKKAENIVVNFTRDNFKEQVILSNPEVIALEDTMLNDPAAFYLMHDSIIIVLLVNQLKIPASLLDINCNLFIQNL